MKSKDWFEKKIHLERGESIAAGKHDDFEDYSRASHLCICTCGKEYWKHPFDGPIGFEGKQFLRRICNGKLVKL